MNPWDWSLKFGYNQGELIEGATRQLICAGQTSVDGEGRPQHIGNMRAQISLALDNLETILAKTAFNLGNVTRITIYATDVDEALKHFDILGVRFGAFKNAPPMSLLGVTRLALPELLFEIEVTAQA